MTTAIDYLQPGQQSAASSAKPLWAAVGILGVAVLAMGGTMIYQQRPAAQIAPIAPMAPVALVAPAAALPLAASTAANATAADDMVEKPAAAAVKPAPAPAKKIVKPTPRPAPAPTYSSNAPYPSPAPAPAPVPVVAQVCATCGSVESVTPVTRTTKPDGPGVGVVAGGVVGAVLGNQVGRGNGRAAATILGAIGGGWAGNAIERNVRKETVYQVGVRMDDGSRRTIEVAQPPTVGSQVTVNGSTIRGSGGGNEGAVYNPPAPVMQRARLPQQPQNNQQTNY
jgi:outer membrane lipoprotein SlyB